MEERRILCAWILGVKEIGKKSLITWFFIFYIFLNLLLDFGIEKEKAKENKKRKKRKRRHD
jgi:hypothetical protein